MIDRRKIIFSGLALLASGVAFSGIAMAGKPKVYMSSSTGVAINGYDPVAYFTQSKPVKGTKDYSVSWNDATWYFSSAENKLKFEGNPDKFAPQYGGYCAYAVSYGSTASTVPEAWTIVDGKLYLNNSLGVRKRWSTDKKGYISKADKNWPKVVQ